MWSVISAGGLFEAKKLEAAAATAAAEATSSPIHLLRRWRRRSLRSRPPAGPGSGKLVGRACIFFKYTGLKTALERGRLTKAA
jgi:hypothetical protein